MNQYSCISRPLSIQNSTKQKEQQNLLILQRFTFDVVDLRLAAA
jgi:hypothetical protein